MPYTPVKAILEKFYIPHTPVGGILKNFYIDQPPIQALLKNMGHLHLSIQYCRLDAVILIIHL